MGNLIRETVKLDDSPTKLNSRITEWATSFEDGSDGVYLKETSTIYTPEGTPVRTSESSLISSTHATLAGKTVIRDARGNEGITWTEYSTPARRILKRQTPGSNTVAEDVLIDGFLISGTDLAGVTTTHARIYTEHGFTLIDTDARGNATIVEQDVSGRSVKVTNAMGGGTTTSYDPATGKPSLVTDALGNTVCFSYDCRGRKIAEYGTGVQPALYAYDDADNVDNVVPLTTFRAGEEAIVSDPTERTDGDTTAWRYDASTGLLLSKTYANGTSANYEYDSMNRLERIINPRSLAAVRTYAPLTGELPLSSVMIPLPRKRLRSLMLIITSACLFRFRTAPGNGNLYTTNTMNWKGKRGKDLFPVSFLILATLWGVPQATAFFAGRKPYRPFPMDMIPREGWATSL